MNQLRHNVRIDENPGADNAAHHHHRRVKQAQARGKVGACLRDDASLAAMIDLRHGIECPT
jgi:hypothetical protein